MKKTGLIIPAILLSAVSLSLWAQNAPDTAQIFKARCASCHGAKGEGLPAVKIPAIKGTSMTVEKIVALITKGEGGKTVHATKIVNINDEEARSIAVYVKNLK